MHLKWFFRNGTVRACTYLPTTYRNLYRVLVLFGSDSICKDLEISAWEFLS